MSDEAERRRVKRLGATPLLGGGQAECQTCGRIAAWPKEES